ncbi:MAG TPA: CsgG/HfaB family protein [Thermoanaerobaculia bacterium]|nr:CsgG/HfaB family protein [Thermoanaerobaculia bacterium]
MNHTPRSTRLFVVALLGLVSLPLLAAGAKPRVAILEFTDKTSHYDWYHAGRAAQDMMVTELVKSGTYSVIERERLQAILAEKNLSLSGDVDTKTAIQAGRLLGVEYLIVGAVTELGVADRNVQTPGIRIGGFGVPSTNVRSQKMDAGLDARAISTTTGEIVWADNARESTSDSSVYVAGAGGGVNDQRKLDRVLRPVVAKLAASLAEKKLETKGLGGTGDASGVVGKIAKADGGTIYLNVGAEAGLKEGAEFDVYRVGEVIKDPDTGEVLGANETKVGRVKILSIKGPRLSQAAAVSGQGFKAGDTLKGK